MSEQILIEQLDEAIDAIIARGEVTTFAANAQTLRELAALGSELRLLPRDNFKSSLKETLRRSAIMTTTGTQKQQSSEASATGYQTVTPYLTVKRAEQLVEFVKEAFGATEVFRTIGSAGGLHAEVTEVMKRLLDYDWEFVAPAIRARLVDAFGFDRRDLGQPVFLSEVPALFRSGALPLDVACSGVS